VKATSQKQTCDIGTGGRLIMMWVLMLVEPHEMKVGVTHAIVDALQRKQGIFQRPKHDLRDKCQKVVVPR